MKNTHSNEYGKILILLPLFFAVTLTAAGNAGAASESKPMIRLFNDPVPAAPAEAVAPLADDAGLPADVKTETEVIPAGMIVDEQPVIDRITEMADNVRVTENADGTTAVEYFDLDKKRTEKLLRDGRDRLLERWLFDPVNQGRITRYEKYAYGSGGLDSYRVAEWEYSAEGSVKTNRLFEADGRETARFLEYAGTNGKKFREEWFDAHGNPSAVKSWDAETGEFQGHILVKDYPLGMKRVEWGDGNRKTVRKELVRRVDMEAFEETLAPMKPKDAYRAARMSDARERGKPPVHISF